jgi:hypothetical protein
MTPDLRSAHWHEVRGRVTGNRLEVYSRLLASGPRTCTELAALMVWDKCSIRPRVTELCELSHAIATGVRRNGEHEFVALTVRDAEALHEAGARRRVATVADEPRSVALAVRSDSTLEFSFL